MSGFSTLSSERESASGSSSRSLRSTQNEIIVKGPYAPDAAGDEALQRYGRDLETEVLLDRELNLSETEVGRDVMAAAAADLRDHGIHIDQATDVQLADALRRVS
jgi:hypothetical protein